MMNFYLGHFTITFNQFGLIRVHIILHFLLLMCKRIKAQWFDLESYNSGLAGVQAVTAN